MYTVNMDLILWLFGTLLDPFVFFSHRENDEMFLDQYQMQKVGDQAAV